MLVAFVCGSSGCGQRTLPIVLPELASVSTLVVAAYSGGELLEARVSALPFGILTVETEQETLRIEVLAYRSTHDELGLPEGELVSSDSGRVVDLPQSAFVSNAGRAFESLPIEQLETTGRSFRLPPRPTPCVTFGSRLDSTNVDAKDANGFALDSNRALLVTAAALFVYDAARGAERFTWTSSPASGLVHGFTTPGKTHVVALDGGVYSLSLDESARTAQLHKVMEGPGLSTDETTFALDGGLDSLGELEVFLLTSGGRFLKGARLGWTASALSLDLPPSGGRKIGDVEWIGPGEAIAVLASDRRILRWTNDATQFEDTSSTTGLMSAAVVPGLDVVVGDAESAFYAQAGAVWEPIVRSPTKFWTLSLEPFPGGFVYGNPFGNFGQYVDGHGLCELQRPMALDIERLIVLSSERILAFTLAEDRLEFALLTRQKK
ncbi:MAG: hypothetical protein HY791_03745 [Deltaproteobacteria bacterium]|nr:hypothetical protein [Deltaproteobacteria bacterium]